MLVQVNVTGEPQKGGCAPGDARALVEACTGSGLRVDGLMTVPPAVGDPRPAFARLRRMADDLGLRECSMGMSGDYEIAIAEGCDDGASGQRDLRSAAGPRRRATIALRNAE